MRRPRATHFPSQHCCKQRKRARTLKLCRHAQQSSRSICDEWFHLACFNFFTMATVGNTYWLDHIYINICTLMHIYTYAHTRYIAHTRASMCTRMYMHVSCQSSVESTFAMLVNECVFVNVYVCDCVWACLCVCFRMRVYVCTCVCVRVGMCVYECVLCVSELMCMFKWSLNLSYI